MKVVEILRMPRDKAPEDINLALATRLCAHVVSVVPIKVMDQDWIDVYIEFIP